MRNIMTIPSIAAALCLAGGCGNDGADPSAPDVPFRYASYRELPGVTEDEIGAVEAMRGEGRAFVYGVNPSTEAFLGEDGGINGFAALFCERLSELFGIPFKPALYEWEDLVAGLESGEIDFSGELTATGERRKTYIMTDPIALRTVKLFRLAGSRPIPDIAAGRLLRYAFLDGVTTEAEVKAASVYPYEVFYVENYEAAYKMLKNNGIDAFFDENSAESVFDVYDDVVSELFFPPIFSDVSLSTQNPALEPIISIVQKKLENGGDRYLGEIYNRGHQAYLENRLHKSLTDRERAYIQDHRYVAIPLLAEYDNYPMSFYNSREKEWQGICFDVLKEVETLTGLSFKVANDRYTEWSGLLAMLEGGGGAMISELIPTDDRKGRFLWPVTGNTRDYFALLSRSDFRNINFNEILHMKVGVVSGIAYAELFKKWFPNHTNTVEYGGSDLMFGALERGEIDLAMASQNQLLFLTNYREQPGYKINLLFDFPYESMFGFYIGDSVLCGIVDKALRVIDRESISTRWTRRVYDYRVKLAEERIPFVFGISGLLLCVLILVLALMLRSRSEGKRLEREVQLRTVELKNSHIELKKAALTAEAANRVKSDFLAKMSHEIRTPMNAITGMAEIALREEMSRTVREHISAIKHAGADLLSIINDILDLSKIESGKLEIIPVDYRFRSLIGDVVSVIKMRLVNRPIEFAVDADDTIPGVLFGDEVRIRQILLNILSNAVKYTKEGSISLSVKGAVTDSDAITLIMSVTDTGIGIKPEDIPVLFGDFVQVDPEANRGIEGTGLGLSIARNLARAMGGDILVSSEYGKGSTFTVTLPQKIRTAARTDALAETEDDNPAGAEFTAPAARVLIVDDIKTNLEVAKGLIGLYGVKIDTCLSGEESIRAVTEKRYDAIFMDQMMPGMDGIETARRIRRLGAESNQHRYLVKVPIIALTANAVSGTREMFLENGFDDFLSKPIDIDLLGAALRRWIPEDKQVAPAPGANADTVAGADTGVDMVIDGVDVNLGLARTGGNVDRYLKTLEVFCGDGREKIEHIKRSSDSGNLRLCATYAHALKSASANIGAVGLSESAKTLEEAGKRGDAAFISGNTARVLDDLKILLADIDRAVAASPKAGVGEGALTAVLTTLKIALEDIDPAAINAGAKTLELLENSAGADTSARLKTISRHILNGNYDDAVLMIDSMVQA